MKKYLIIIKIFLFIINLHATETRVKSLGDLENPVTGKISGLIKDDIVDIYFNPACVNDVKAFLILTSFDLSYGTDSENNPKDEKSNEIEYNTTGKKITTTERNYTRKGYNFSLDTGVLIPLAAFNLFINYRPQWVKFTERYKENKTTYDGATLKTTNTFIETHQNTYTNTPLPFDITMGFNIADTILLGIRTGYFKYDQDEAVIDANGDITKKGEFTKDRFIIGSGIKFNFSDKISMSLVADVDLAEKNDSPAVIQEGFTGSGNNNYDSSKGIYTYLTTENESGYNFRFIPEIELNRAREKFIRILTEVNIVDYEKNFDFNQKGDLKNYEIQDFKKNKLIGNLGLSYNHRLSPHAKGVYGFKYIGLLNGVNQYKFYENKANKNEYRDYKEESYDNFLGLFLGFDVEITKYFFIRSGVSQGLYRYALFKTFDRTITSTQETVEETIAKNEYYLPNTDFTLGFYIQPVNNLTMEFNFTGKKDWNVDDFSTSNSEEKENGTTTKTMTKYNYDITLGMSITYKVSFQEDQKEKKSTHELIKNKATEIQ